jgi:hypothetical protein
MRDKYLQDLLAIQTKIEGELLLKKLPELSIGDRVAAQLVRGLLHTVSPGTLKKLDRIGIAPGAKCGGFKCQS